MRFSSVFFYNTIKIFHSYASFLAVFLMGQSYSQLEKIEARPWFNASCLCCLHRYHFRGIISPLMDLPVARFRGRAVKIKPVLKRRKIKGASSCKLCQLCHIFNLGYVISIRQTCYCFRLGPIFYIFSALSGGGILLISLKICGTNTRLLFRCESQK
jgi:hypothetical protein